MVPHPSWPHTVISDPVHAFCEAVMTAVWLPLKGGCLHDVDRKFSFSYR